MSSNNSTSLTAVHSICNCIALDVLGAALQLLDSRDLVRFAAAESCVLWSLRDLNWVFYAARCLTPAALAELADLGVQVRLESHLHQIKGDDGSDSQRWIAPDGRYHREDDLPAIIAPPIYEAWYHHGRLHRDHDRPALVRGRTGRWWYFRGVLHRGGDLPAIEWSNGTREWWVMGKRFRKDGGHVIEHPNGDREWRDDDSDFFANRKDDLPCFERANGDLEWRTKGVLHRGGLPAVFRTDGTQEWWYHGDRTQ